MIAALLATLFAAAGLFAVASIALTWRRYGAAALAVHGQLRACPETRGVTWTITETVVRPARAGTVLRGDFTRRAKASPARSAPWPVAA